MRNSTLTQIKHRRWSTAASRDGGAVEGSGRGRETPGNPTGPVIRGATQVNSTGWTHGNYPGAGNPLLALLEPVPHQHPTHDACTQCRTR
jgi:hypothetical protein